MWWSSPISESEIGGMFKEENDRTSQRQPAGLLNAFKAMSNDDTPKILIVAFLVCLFCSILVSTAAVTLKPLQEHNKILDRQRNLLQVSGLFQEGKPIEELFKPIETKVVDLSTGEYVTGIDPHQYDQREAARDPDRSVSIPSEKDTAKVGRRAKFASVYLVKENNEVKNIILPIHGYGLWSTLYGFLVLEKDGNTVFGLQFYEHGETPGLGGNIDNQDWRQQWRGKLAYGDSKVPMIEVARARVPENDPEFRFKVDGLSGATITGQGVTNLLRYWLGEDGFGLYLRNIRS